MNLLADAADWLRRAESEHLSEVVDYVRDVEVFRISAVIGRTPFEADNGNGIVVTMICRDFIVAADALPFKPRRGDSVMLRGEVYEVLAPDGEPEWRWSDPSATAMRIHTRKSGGADV